MREIVRSDEEINAVLNKAMEAEDTGQSKFFGMKYEEGIVAMHDWLVGDTDTDPMMD